MLVTLLRAGWAPIDDEATISWRAWDVFAGHGPLVGQFTQASNGTGHSVFSPGPLLYWALALPVHIAPGAGPLIGVTVLAVVSIMLACLAAAAVGGRAAAVVVSGGTTLVVWSAGYQLDTTIWNPYAALVPFAATLIVAWAVAGGRVGWWPCLVGLASFCMQAHLMYVPAAGALLVGAPLVGIVASRRTGRAIGWRWAAIGATVAALCWAAPVWQQLTAARGNVSLLLDSTLGQDGAKLGLDVGLRNVSRAVAPLQPLWLRPPAKAVFLETGGISPRWAIGAFVGLAAIVVVGWRRKRHDVTAVTLVALVADLSALAVIAGIPTHSGLTIVYIQYVLWPVGAMTWFALGYSLASFTEGVCMAVRF